MNSHRRVMQQLSDARPEQLDVDESQVRIEDITAQPRVAFQPRPRRTGRLVFAGAVPVAAAMIVLALTQTSTPQPIKSSPKTLPTNTSQAAMTAEQMLLAAAEQALRTAPDSGKYWAVKDEHGSIFTTGSKNNRYSVVQRSSSELWLTAKENKVAWSAGQDLGAAPVTAADEAAWRRDGSPTQWFRKGDGKTTDSIVKAAPGKPHTSKGSPWQMVPTLGGALVSFEEIKALPADPAALRAWLLARYERNPDKESGSRNERLIWDGIHILLRIPGINPQQRAATYRMLAGVGGVRNLGETKDASGRVGVAIGWDSHGGDGDLDQRLIFSLSTGEPLAWETHELRPGHNGRLLGYFLILSQGWTDGPLPA